MNIDIVHNVLSFFVTFMTSFSNRQLLKSTETIKLSGSPKMISE